MFKKRTTLTVLIRLGLGILAWEAVFLGLAWLLHRYWRFLQPHSFADVLFFMAALAFVMGSAGMMRNPYGVPLTPLGVWASPVQPTEDERRAQRLDEIIHQRAFGLRTLAVALITFLLSIALTYIK
jgi:hypothetical protein